MEARYRTIFVSDLHLGAEESRASDFLDFLDTVSADRIYLVGDIVDIERLQNRPLFPQSHGQVIARLVQLADSGIDVRYIPGNHDHPMRSLVGRDICGIPVMMEAEHQTANGKSLLVVHGDVLDGVVNKGSAQHSLGATAYRLIMRVDVTVNQVRGFLGQDYVSISSAIKNKVRLAYEYIRRYESCAAELAAERGFDGIVCGHIHRPCIREIDGVIYANDGDWVEHRTALAELQDGSLQLLHWKGGTVVTGTLSRPDTLAA
ncbi:MAG: UDP-2,3-diacylglucosamine diphosphatase [Gammaproteobacteria bacterium]|nr:UDP-2,3-diacylglucosamine diphosphatase [Gammaproteobacteria bacterium]